MMMISISLFHLQSNPVIHLSCTLAIQRIVQQKTTISCRNMVTAWIGSELTGVVLHLDLEDVGDGVGGLRSVDVLDELFGPKFVLRRLPSRTAL